ncbi:hypothetical protein DICSQDRAFT_132620 [Dichomitus squalens LYAD-421 SS1]|uniref:uncharacterized protein n=1 Tax=Dichomitus squalens (strain LYAD-421) TaxID=732165 RepID=UPI0004411F95|nr:uncharacterized protein DICSQDRAFT_132620 [Dichomitus squalens LYAD-421 SS1]EJF65078.1 hypothetical protein DICSQDRAFT_132620 [Dichomitus squalens LYAD-421 SS1]
MKEKTRPISAGKTFKQTTYPTSGLLSTMMTSAIEAAEYTAADWTIPSMTLCMTGLE